MRINALRRELSRLILPQDAIRKPAIRRSLREEWLYATNLPMFAEEEQVRAVRKELGENGWESSLEEGWMQLRKAADEPPEGWFDGPFSPEAACCRSLLARHPERRTKPDRRIAYALIRAGEEGPDAYEKLCGRLHREWAGKLRRKQGLPEISLRYFEGGERDAVQAYRSCGISDGNG